MHRGGHHMDQQERDRIHRTGVRDDAAEQGCSQATVHEVFDWRGHGGDVRHDSESIGGE